MNLHLKSKWLTSLLALSLVLMVAVPQLSAASPATINLGTASTFAILAGSTITNTGTSIINGNIGLSPGTEFTQGPATVNGIIHLADAVALQAKEDLVSAYNDADGRPADRISTELGGMTLTPGVYDSADGTFELTGILTLDAQGDPDAVFIFKTTTTLVTATGSSVNLINSAKFSRTFWKIGSSATIGINAHFEGIILAMESITVTTGTTVQGQLLARNGAVTLDTDTITTAAFTQPVASVPAILYVIKNVVNDNGGTAIAADFALHVKTLSGDSVIGSPAPGAEAPGTAYELAPGSYVVSEDAYEGYTVTFSGDSDANGNVTLAAGEIKTVTVTNTDIPVVVIPPTEPVTPPTEPVTPPTETETGGQLPDTSTNMFAVLLFGASLTFVGAIGWKSSRHFE